jgi:hypothetical protein
MVTMKSKAKSHVGIRRHGPNWQAYVRVSGQLYARTFPLETPLDEMQAWRRSQRPELVRLVPAVQVHELSDALKTEFLTIAQDAIRDQANGKGATLKGIRARLYPETEKAS